MVAEISFGSLIQVKLAWPDFKLIIASKNIKVQYVDCGNIIKIFAIESSIVYLTQILKQMLAPREWDIVGTLIDPDIEASYLVDFDSNFKNASNTQIEPRDSDGTPIVIPYPATNGYRTMFTSKDDNGQAFNLTFAGPGTQHIDMQYNDPVEVHDGAVYWYPPFQVSFINGIDPVWDFDDTFSFKAIFPATPAIETPGVGNVEKVAIGDGINMFVPAPQGGWTVDLDLAVPVPAESFDASGVLRTTGFWNCDYITGDVTPGQYGSAFRLLDFEASAILVNDIAMGNPVGSFEIEVYKIEWFHQRWIQRFSCTKSSPGAGRVGGWIMLFRKP